jgi:hypothetical protein
MFPSRLARLALPLILAAALGGSALAQKERYGTMYLTTKVGSFKILGVAQKPAEGHLEISFTGTLLVNGTPKITPSGNLRVEFNKPERKQIAYHGTGKLVIDGKYDAIQWFGRDMNATWTGFGIVRLVGEFDKDLNTGQYWYSDNPNDKRSWTAQLNERPNPGRPVTDFTVIPKARGGG